VAEYVSADGQPFNLATPSGANPGTLAWGDKEGLPAAFGLPQQPLIVASGIASTSTVGQPIISTASADHDIVLSGIASTSTVGQPIISTASADHDIVLSGIASTSTVGQPIIGSVTEHTIVLTGIGPNSTVGRPTIGSPPPRGSVRPPDIDRDRLLAQLRAQALQEDGELLLFAAELVCSVD
jgi:hypothetical protein